MNDSFEAFSFSRVTKSPALGSSLLPLFWFPKLDGHLAGTQVNWLTARASWNKRHLVAPSLAPSTLAVRLLQQVGPPPATMVVFPESNISFNNNNSLFATKQCLSHPISSPARMLFISVPRVGGWSADISVLLCLLRSERLSCLRLPGKVTPLSVQTRAAQR